LVIVRGYFSYNVMLLFTARSYKKALRDYFCMG